MVNERCFSSSLACTAVCNCSNGRLLTVGISSEFIGGRGVPLFLSLPNSKLIFELICTLAPTERQKPQDYYDNKMYIPVLLSIADYIFEANYPRKRYGKFF